MKLRPWYWLPNDDEPGNGDYERQFKADLKRIRELTEGE